MRVQRNQESTVNYQRSIFSYLDDEIASGWFGFHCSGNCDQNTITDTTGRAETGSDDI